MNDVFLNNEITNLYSDLETVMKEHDELMDTDVRESIHYVLTYYFVWGNEQLNLPISYCMFSEKGDKALAAIIKRFLESINLIEGLKGIPHGQKRLDFLQNPNLKTAEGRQFDDFIGYVKKPLNINSLPEYFFEIGDYE